MDIGCVPEEDVRAFEEEEGERSHINVLDEDEEDEHLKDKKITSNPLPASANQLLLAALDSNNEQLVRMSIRQTAKHVRDADGDQHPFKEAKAKVFEGVEEGPSSEKDEQLLMSKLRDWPITIISSSDSVRHPDLKGNRKLTALEYTGMKGSSETYHFLIKIGMAPTDGKKMEAAHKTLVLTESTNDTDEAGRRETQLYYTMLQVQTARDKHLLAAQFYGVRHQYLLFLPATILSTVAAILAFIASSAMDVPRWLTLMVGVISSVSAFIQTVSDQLQYNSQQITHLSAAHELSTILNTLAFSDIDQIGRGASNVFIDADVKTIRKQFLQIEQTCKSVVPSIINASYDPPLNELERTRILVYETTANDDSDDEDAEAEVSKLLVDDATRITAKITGSRCWPWNVDVGRVIKSVREDIMKQERTFAEKTADKEGDNLYAVLKAAKKKIKGQVERD